MSASPSHTAAAPPAAETSHRTKGLLRLTMACNERCPFCNVPVEDYRRPTPPEAEIQQELDAFVASGEQTLTLSGGEPTLLRKRLLGLIRQARERGIPFVELQTNAVLIDEGYARDLAGAGLTSAFISLLSDRAEIHDALAGLDGAFPRCLRGIDALLDAGIRVTLNPVLARLSQDRVADYISFVAERLPRVRSISLSAVQPHGRAGRDGATDELLPDYAVLARIIPEARRRAEAAGIELLNPYCGLPLCIGWAEDPERSVEAVEAGLGGWRPVPGLENTGDKEHGPPCLRCALRTRCGGAWKAYWQLRAGSGIAAPAQLVLPWEEGTAPFAQTTIAAPDGPTHETWDLLRQQEAPTVLLHTASLDRGDALRLLGSGCTDLALDLDPAGLSDPASPRRRHIGQTLQQLRRLVGMMADLPPQRRLRAFLHLRRGPGTGGQDLALAQEWALGLGVPVSLG